MSASLEILIPADIRFPLERANGVQIVKTAAALARAGARTTLLVRRSDPRPTDELLGLYGVAPHPRLTVERLAVGHRTGVFAVPRALFLGRVTAACLARQAIVYTRDLQLTDVLLAARGLWTRKLVYEAHAVESLLYTERGTIYGTGEEADPRKAARIGRREARVWRGAGGFVATTAGIRETFAELYGPRERTCVIPNGCDVPGDRTFPGLPAEGAPLVLYAGQLYPWKGVDILVEAIAQVSSARLTVIGGLEGEPDLARIRALVAARGLAARVDLVGTVPQARVAEELKKAAVVAVPFLKTAMTERHTSPIKAFEAMAAGRPIVASDLPSSREFLRDGQNSLLVPPGDAAALAAAIRRLITDRDLALRLARTAYEEAPRHSWDSRAQRLVALMEAL